MTNKRNRFTPEVRALIVCYARQGHGFAKISNLLKSEHNLFCSRQGIRKFLLQYRETGEINIRKRPDRLHTRLLNDVEMQFVNMWITENNEVTARDLQIKLKKNFNVEISVSSVNKLRQTLGWTKKNTQYCQLISTKNQLKREQWALSALSKKETFHDVIFVDETSIELMSSGKLSFYKLDKIDCLPIKAPKPKHSYKVHMWAGISYKGRTDCCIFTGVMDSKIYQQILEKNLLPFVRVTHPNGFRLYQDNDSKHCSKATKEWFEKNNISHTVMTVPASSPDLNPIENVWASLKDFLQRHVKPKLKYDLVAGIVQFWNGLTAEQCGKYIDHIHKVIPEICLNRGGPTRY